MDVGSILSGGGIAGLIVALAYAGHQYVDWRGKRPSKTSSTTAAVGDAETANAILTSSLAALRTENDRMAKKIKHLEREAAEKDAKIDELTARVNDIASELADLKSGVAGH